MPSWKKISAPRSTSRISAQRLAYLSEHYARVEHLGMSPKEYLSLRRMNMARHELREADSTATTVTDIAMRYGFWELGRFAVGYRRLFGEAPSATLHRAP